MKKYLLLLSLLIINNVWGQISIPNTTPVTQNFDGMAATTTLPTNWKMHASTSSPTYSGASATVTQQASSGTPSSGGTYNWGSSTSERAVGAMTSSSFASPNNLIGYFRNTNTGNLTDLTISYDAERYRINTATASVQFFYSLNGSTWTAVTAGDIATTSFPTGTSAYNFTTGTVVNKTGITISGLSIANNGDFYLRWNLNTVGGNSQGIGIDNVSVTATFAPSATISTTGTLSAVNTTYGTASASPTTFNVSGVNMSAGILVTPPAEYEVSLASGSGYAPTVTVGAAGTISSTPVYVRLTSTATVSGSPYSGNIVLSSTGATSVNVATVSSTVSPLAITVSGITANNKVQDGNDIATLNFGSASLSGVVNSDPLTIGSTYTATFPQTTTGTGLSVTVSGLGVSGTNSSSYILTQPTGLTADITAPTSVISTSGSLAAVSTTYGTASASPSSFSVSGTGIVSPGIVVTAPTGYEVSLSSGSGYASSVTISGTGTISSTAVYVRLTSTATVSGSPYSGNIVLTSSGAMTVNVTTVSSTVSPLALTITGATVTNKAYDGTTTAIITGASLTGIVNSDVVTLNPIYNFSTANVGTGISVTSTSTLGGANAGNYTLTQPTGLTGDITKANQTITFTLTSPITTATSSVALNGTAPAGIVTYTSSNTAVATVSGSTLTIVGVGSTTITASQAGNSNYNAAVDIVIALTVNMTPTTFNFDTLTNWTAGSAALTSYAANHIYTSNNWTFTTSAGTALQNSTVTQDGFASANGTYSWRLFTGLVDWVATSTDTVTVASFGFNHRRWDNSPNPSFNVDYSIDGGLSWINAATAVTYTTSSWQTFNYTISNPFTTLANKFKVRISKTGSTDERIFIDDFQFTRGIPTNGCSPSVTSGSVSGLTSICVENGWEYYGNNNGRYFAIQKASSGLAGESVSIDIEPSIPVKTSSNGTNQENASYFMKRSWNVTATTQPSSPVKIRFYFDPTDSSDVITLRDADSVALKNTSTGANPSSLAVKTPFEWFKTVGVPYNTTWRNLVVGNKFPATHKKLAAIGYGTQSGAHYVEFLVDSFSGGTGGAGFGPQTGGSVGLPVTWAGFEISTNENGNILNWKTSSEHNTSHFEVEFSYDGKNFTTVNSKINAAGNSNILTSYNFTHSDFATIIYYRIKQIDKDNRFSHSEIKSVKRTSVSAPTVSVYPMPLKADNILKLKINSIDLSEINLKMINLTGKVVYSNSILPKSDSINETIDLSNLPSGIYFLEIKNGQFKTVKKLFK